MSIYILEIKNRVVLIFLTWCSILLIGYFYKEVLLFVFLESKIFKSNEFKIDYFIFTNVTEVFSVYLKLILFISFQILFIYVFYHSFIFLSHGLFIFEYCYLKYLLKVIMVIWFLSIIMSKYILIPTMWDFFFNFQNSSFMQFHFEAKLNEYVDFYIKFYYLFIVYSQIFTLIFIFFMSIKNNIYLIKKSRKLFYYFFVLFATFVSPPEVFSQLILSFSLIFFYEFFILLFIFKWVSMKLIR